NRDQPKVVPSDIPLGKLVVIPDDLMRLYNIQPHQFYVATPIRIRPGYPSLFTPQQTKHNDAHTRHIIDGGLERTSPLWLIRTSNNDLRPVIGVSLREDSAKAEAFTIKNALDMLQALFMTMLRAHDTRYISKSKEKNIIFIRVKKIGATDLTISKEKQASLIDLGVEHTKAFLKNWP